MKLSLLALFASFFTSSLLAQESTLKSPNVSANALFLYRNSNFSKDATSTERNGIDLHEAELAFNADVDPYSRLNLLLAIAPEYTLNSGVVEKSWGIEPEVLYGESSYFKNLNLKIGKFKAMFGKTNLLHTHSQPLTDNAIVNTSLLGDGGLNDVGLSAAYLLPTPWFSELSAEYLRGEGEKASFNSSSPNDAVGVYHFKNLFDINQDTTLEIGASYAHGKNSLAARTNLAGADLTLKWRPADGGKYTSALLAIEYIKRDLKDVANPTEKGSGHSILGQYQFAQRWLGLLRYESLKVENANTISELNEGTIKKYSLGLEFKATEFSSYRVEYNTSKLPSAVSEKDEKKFYFQANFTIGAHPAHTY